MPRLGHEPVDLILAVCDHYEPFRGGVSMDKARARVQQWVDEYPRRFDRFRDEHDRPPQHSFFYPADEYHPELVDMIAGLCRKGYGEVEIHLHHGRGSGVAPPPHCACPDDPATELRNWLVWFRDTLRDQHGLLGTDQRTGKPAYGFIHGNWALDNARSDGTCCGVNNELDILRETGCYADFTLPSAPSETQTRKINSIYWAIDDPKRAKSHNSGVDLGTAPQPPNSLLMIQGPLKLDWAKKKFGILPGIENSCLQKSQPPSISRLNRWLEAGVKIPTQPSWYFAKLHTHGVWEPNQDVLLGEPMERFHEELQRMTELYSDFRVYYVSAREMANLTIAATEHPPTSVLNTVLRTQTVVSPAP